MAKENKSILVGILSTALIVIALSIILYFNAYFLMGNIIVNTTRPMGFTLMGIITLIISVIWLFCYWLMDKVKKEPVKMMLYSFFSALVVHFLLVTFINKALSLSSINVLSKLYSTKNNLTVNVLLPMFSISLIFNVYIFKLNSFDETVDSLIYGGFVGVGIAAADCFVIFFKMDILSLQYLLMTVTTKTMLCSAVCAFAGFLLRRLKEKNNFLNFTISIISLFLIFTVEFFLETIVDNNLALSQNQIIDFIIPLAVTIVIFGFIVASIYRIIVTSGDYTDETKEDVSESSEPENMKNTIAFSEEKSVFKAQKPFHIITYMEMFVIIIFVAIFINLIIIWNISSRNQKYYAPDNSYSFVLPDGFVEKKAKSFSLQETDEYQFKGQHFSAYQKNNMGIFSTTDIFIAKGENFIIEKSKELYFSPQKGCRIYSNNKFQSGNKTGKNIDSFILVKGEDTLFVDIITANDNQDVENLIRLISQSLSFN